MQFCIFEDNAHKNFSPLVSFRPVFDLRSGCLSLRERIQSFLPRRNVSLLCRDSLTRVLGEQNLGSQVNVPLPEEDTWFINGRLLADENLLEILHKNSAEKVYRIAGEPALGFVSGPRVRRVSASLEALETFPSVNIEGRMARFPWDLVHNAAEEISRHFRILKKKAPRSSASRHPGAHLVNRSGILLGRGSVLKPGAVIDAEKGPVILGNNVTVMSNAVIVGPAFIGEGTVVKVGAKIYPGSSIGPRCKVGGEIESSLIQSFSNKQHDGFLGHSYLGSWVNIGADTNTSDLKNTYGTVRVMVNGLMVDTGHMFVGLTMGDHSKSGINVMFDTGTVVGVSCNIYGATLPPKFLPSFSWGGEGKFTEYDLGKSIETARRVMLRRDVTMGPAYEELFRAVHASTGAERRLAGVS